MTGVSVCLYRCLELGDCSNNGVSSPKNAEGKIFVVFDEAIRQGNYNLEKSKDNPDIVCLKVVRRGAGKFSYMHLEPMFPKRKNAWTMFGGNYAGSSDSRFSDLSKYPLPIHDRIE